MPGTVGLTETSAGRRLDRVRIVCVAVKRLGQISRVHLLHLLLELAIVATIVWVVTRVLLTPVLADEGTDFALESLPAFAHPVDDRPVDSDPQGLFGQRSYLRCLRRPISRSAASERLSQSSIRSATRRPFRALGDTTWIGAECPARRKAGPPRRAAASRSHPGLTR
jgi:hypothetical protein